MMFLLISLIYISMIVLLEAVNKSNSMDVIYMYRRVVITTERLNDTEYFKLSSQSVNDKWW